MKLLKLIPIIALTIAPSFALAQQFVSAPLVPVPNQTGLNSATPFQFFSQGEYINLVDGHLTIEPKGFETQVYGINLTINPAYNPNRDIFGREEFLFSEFDSDEYPTLDGNDADRVEVIPIEEDLGAFGHFSAKVEGNMSRFKIRLNQEKWQMAINGIVGMIGVWFSPPEYENTGEDGMINPSNLPAYFLIKSDGSVVFISAIEQGFRKAYGVWGSQDIKNAESRFNDVVIEDTEGIKYHFSKDTGFLSQGNRRYVETKIKAIDCYWFLFWEECTEYLHFPGWKVQTLFLKKIEDAFGNDVDIIPNGGENYLVRTPKGEVDIEKSGNAVNVRSRLGGDPNGRTWKYSFDDKGDLQNVQYPGGLATTYHYSLASGYSQPRQVGEVFTDDKNPDNVLEVHYPTGGVLRYEAFYSHFYKGVIVTEFPDPSNTDDFFQKYVLSGVGSGGGSTTVFETDGTRHIYNYTQKAKVLVLASRETKFLNETITSFYNWDVRPVHVETTFAKEDFELINGPSLVASTSNGVSFEMHFAYDGFGRLIKRTDPLGTEYRYGYQCDNLYNTDLSFIETSKVGIGLDGTERTDAMRMTVTPFFPVNCEPEVRLKYDYSYWRDMMDGPDGRGIEMDADQQAQLTQIRSTLNQIKTFFATSGDIPNFETFKALFDRFRAAASNFSGINFPFLVGEVNISAGGINRTIMRNFFNPETGNIIRSEDEAGNGTTYSFDGPYLKGEINYANSLDSDTVSGAIANPNPDPSNFSKLGITGKMYDWGNRFQDAIIHVTDTSGGSQTFNRDPSGNITGITFGGGASVLNKYEFFNGGARIETTVHNTERPTDVVQTRIHDGLGFVREERLGDAAPTRYSYARSKRVNHITLPDGRVQQFAYDGAGRITNKITPEGDHLKFTYGRQFVNQFGTQIPTEKIEIGRGNGAFLIAYRDPLGRIARVDRPSESGIKTDRYRYDNLGNLIAHESPDGRTATNSFDAISRLAGRKFSDGSKWLVTQFGTNQILDPVSILLEGVVDGNNPAPARSFDITYDTRDRPTDIKFAGAMDSYLKLTYDEYQYYDSNLGKTITQNGLGNLTTIEDESGKSKFFYGGFDKVTAVARTINGTPVEVPYIVAIMQDGFGNPSRVKYPRPKAFAQGMIPQGVNVLDGPEVFYVSDSKGRLSEVKQGNSLIARLEYDGTDQLTRLTYGNGVTSDYTYALSGRLDSVKVKNGEKIIMSEEYAYDYFGNKTWERHLDGSVTEYVHDSYNRPTEVRSIKSGDAKPFFTQKYTYDTEGNLATYSDNRRTITYHYNNGRLASYDTGAYSSVILSYDGFGNVSEERHVLKGHDVLIKNFVYDNLGRLKEVTTSNKRNGFFSRAQYTYDAWGRRQMKDAAGKKKYYIYGQSSSPMVELNAYGLPENFHIYAGGRRIAILDSKGMRYVHSDTDGSTRLIMNSDGRVVKRANYDIRGNILFSVGSDQIQFGFGGMEVDAETGLIFTGGSYFNPLTGQIVAHNTNVIGAHSQTGFTEATTSVMSYLSDMATKLPADPGGFYSLGRGMIRTASIFDVAGVDDFGGAGSLCMQVTSWPGTYGACTSSASNIRQLANLTNGLDSRLVRREIEAGFRDKIIDNIKKYMGYNVPIWGYTIEGVVNAGVAVYDLIKEEGLAGIPMAPVIFVFSIVDYFTQPIQAAFEWVGQHFFGFGPDFRELDHTPQEWDHTNIASPKNNVEQQDSRLIRALEPMFGFGQDSAAILQDLAMYGIVPPFGDALGPRGNFGLMRQIALPFEPFGLQGNPAPMAFGGQIYNAIP